MNRLLISNSIVKSRVPCACRDEPEVAVAVVLMDLCSLRLQG